jgi:hypothetical protein
LSLEPGKSVLVSRNTHTYTVHITDITIMPARPKRTATEKAPNYSDLIASLPEEGEVEQDEDEDGSTASLSPSFFPCFSPKPTMSFQLQIVVKPDPFLPSTPPPHQSYSPAPKRTPKRERSPESPVEEDDGGQYHLEEDIKTPIKARKTSAQSSPSKRKTTVSPKKGGKFESTP